MSDSADPSPGATRRAADVLAVLLVSAITAGFITAAIAWYRRGSRDGLRTYMSYDIGWMSPVGHAVVLAPVALLALALVLLRPRLDPLRWATFLLGSVATFSVLLLWHPKLQLYAVAILAIGIASQLAAMVGRSPQRWRRRLDRGAIGLVLALGIVAGYRAVSRVREERSLLAGLPGADANAPNVLLIILDTVRASNLSLYGYSRETSPFLTAFAREGATFAWAFSAAPWTLPSHASMFTGRYASQAKADWDYPLDSDIPTLAESFRSRGYVTGGFTANLVATTGGFGLARGFTHYDDFPFTLTQCVLAAPLGQAESLRNAYDALVHQGYVSGALRQLAKLVFVGRFSYPDNDWKTAESVIGAFRTWQGGVQGRPWFAFVNLFDAHGPYLHPAPYAGLFGKGERSIDKYDRSIRYIDDQLKLLMDSLRTRGQLDNTVVVISADHGEQFGEHGMYWHGNSLYEQLLHVPLIVRYPPRVPAATVVARQVSLRDLAATLTDLSSLRPDVTLPGYSLASAWGGTPATSTVVSELSQVRNALPKELNANGDMHSVVTDSLQYIRDGNGGISLFDYRRDPRAEHDIWSGPLAPIARQLDSTYRRALDGGGGGARP